MTRLPTVEKALQWTFLQKYTYAPFAAREYAKATELVAIECDGGIYANYLEFRTAMNVELHGLGPREKLA